MAVSALKTHDAVNYIRAASRSAGELNNRLRLRVGDKIESESGMKFSGCSWLLTWKDNHGVEIVLPTVSSAFFNQYQNGISRWEISIHGENRVIMAYPISYFAESISRTCEPRFHSEIGTHLMPKPVYEKHRGTSAYYDLDVEGVRLFASGPIFDRLGGIIIRGNPSLSFQSATLVPMDKQPCFKLDARNFGESYSAAVWKRITIERKDGTKTIVEAECWDYPGPQNANVAFEFSIRKEGPEKNRHVGVITVVEKPKLNLAMPEQLRR